MLAQIGRRASLRVLRPERLLSLQHPVTFVIVGGTCAGKSTVAHAAVAHPTLAGHCQVAHRHSTRPVRRGDDEDGMTSVSWATFRENVAGGRYALAWERPMSDGLSVGYGCLPTSEGMTAILLAGHGIYSNPASVRPHDALQRSVIIGVAAPYDVRSQRLRNRSPDVIARGMAITSSLLDHDDARMLESVDLLILNHGPHAEDSCEDASFAMAAILDVGC